MPKTAFAQLGKCHGLSQDQIEIDPTVSWPDCLGSIRSYSQTAYRQLQEYV